MRGSRWEVILRGGNPSILHQIINYSNSLGHFWLWGGIDDYLDCRNDDFRFNSSYFPDGDGDQEEEMVWNIAYELLDLFNGALSLYFYNHLKFRFSEILKDGTPTRNYRRKAAVGLLGPLAEENYRVMRNKPAHQVFSVLELATENTDVYHFLKFLEQGDSYINHYRILETLENHAKEQSINIPINKEQRKRFSNTANNFSLSGFNGRHGFKEVLKKNNTDIMSIDESGKFIRKAIQQYIHLKYHKKP